MIKLQLHPVDGIKMKEKQPEGYVAVTAFGSDPQFAVAWEGKSIPKGWYEFVLRTSNIERSLVDPALYVDYGAGMHERDRIPLPLAVGGDADGASRRAVVNFHSDVFGLRFDPSIGACKFDLIGCELHRISRLSALRKMSAAVLGAVDERRAKLSLLCMMATKALAIRPGVLGSWLRGRYLNLGIHAATDYAAWVALYGSLQGPRPGEVEALPEHPIFSVLVPVYNTPEIWLRRCIESVFAQSYPYWELCISDDASPSPGVRRLIQGYAARDSRIKAVFREKNGHISESSNDALRLATGKYVALLDHDDELHPHALFEMAKAFSRHPEWRISYSDEDKIDEKGRRFDPYFKSDWNYDLFLSHNCISHLGVYERELLESVGGFRKGVEGSQDWDLALRCIETLGPGQIGHVPHVLYHWRAIPGSTALAPGEKNYAHVAAMKCIQGHLDRVGRDAKVFEIPERAGNYRVKNALPAIAPHVSLIMPTRDRADLLRISVNSILERTRYADYELIIVDNGSIEEATFVLFEELKKKDRRVRVIRYDKPFNYSAINNYAVTQAMGSVIGLVNNDIEVITSDWLEEMVSQAAREDIGAVGAMLYFPNGAIQHAGIVLGFNGVAVSAYGDRPRGWLGHMLRAQLVQNYSAVTAACLVVRKPVYEEVGGLDESLAVAYNDIDFCLRIRDKGYRNLWTPYAELYHHESASRGADDASPEKKERFLDEVRVMRDRWDKFLAHDPAYNPNLALTGETFDLAFPPRH